MNWRSIPGLLPLRNALEILVGWVAYGWIKVFKTNNIVILAYHSISESPWIHAVSKPQFEQQIQWLKQYTLPITLTEAENQAKNNIHQTSQPQVVITFDDGYEDWTTNASPVLKASSIPATFFITTTFTTVTSEPQIGLTPMKQEEVAILAEAGFEIGSHSHTHADLAHCPEDQLVSELEESKRVLEAMSGQTISHLSYPKGRFITPRFQHLKRTGYTMALAGHGPLTERTELMATPRLPVTKALSNQRLQARIYRLAAWGF